jgi:hypothetical protein
LPDSEGHSLQALAPALERSLSYWVTALGIPPGRSLTIHGLHFVNSGQAFFLSNPARPPSPSQPDPSPAAERTPIPQTRSGGLLETVQKALAGIGGGEENSEGGKPPRK